MSEASEHLRAQKYICLVNKRVRSDKNIGRARRTLPALAGSTVSWEDSFRFSVITANSLSQPRCAPSRVSVFYPEFGPRVPDDHPPASPPAFAAATRCPRRPASTSIVQSSKEVPASSGKVYTPISPAIRKVAFSRLTRIKIARASADCDSTYFVTRGRILGRVPLKGFARCALLKIVEGRNVCAKILSLQSAKVSWNLSIQVTACDQWRGY